MTKRKIQERVFAPNVGVAPPSPVELSDHEQRIYDETFKQHTHLDESAAELVAQYAVKVVLCTSLERHVTKNGASVETRTGGSKRSPEAVLLADALKAVASLRRALALTDDEKQKRGIVSNADLTAPFVELARRKGVRRGLEGDELAQYIHDDLARLGMVSL